MEISSCHGLLVTVSTYVLYFDKKSLKIPKGQSESVILKNNRQHNGQKKKYKRTNNDIQNIHIK